MDLFFKEERQDDRVKMILDVTEEMNPDMFALNMFRYNDIRYLVPVQQMRFNDQVCFQYDITTLKPLSEHLQQTMRKEEAIRMFDGILQAFEEMEAYMLTESNLVLDREYVYVDGTGQCHFIYLPLEQEIGSERLGFLRDLAGRITPAPEAKDPYLFDIQNAFSRGAVNSFSDFKDIIHKTTAKDRAVHEVPMATAAVNPEPAVDREKSGGSFSVPDKKGAGASFNVPDKKETGIPFSVPDKKGTGISFQVPNGKKVEVPFDVPDKKDSGMSFRVPDKKKASAAVVAPDKNVEHTPVAVTEENGVNNGVDGEKKGIGKIFAGKKSAGRHSKEKAVKNAVPDIPVVPSVPIRQKNDIYVEYEKTVFMENENVSSGQDDPRVTICLQNGDFGPIGELVRRKTGERIPVMQSGAVIGSGASADCIIRGNRAISRKHAVIVLQNGNFYIMDKHSSNGTEVNGKKIVPEQETEIADGTIIRLADEEFEFKAL